MIEPEDTESEKKKYKINKIEFKTGKEYEIELDFQDAVIDLLRPISAWASMMIQAGMAQVQPSGGRKFIVIDPKTGRAI